MKIFPTHVPRHVSDGGIIHGSAPDRRVAQGEAAGLDNVQRYPQTGGQSEGCPKVLRNVRLKKGQTHSKAIRHREWLGQERTNRAKAGTQFASVLIYSASSLTSSGTGACPIVGSASQVSGPAARRRGLYRRVAARWPTPSWAKLPTFTPRAKIRAVVTSYILPQSPPWAVPRLAWSGLW